MTNGRNIYLKELKDFGWHDIKEIAKLVGVKPKSCSYDAKTDEQFENIWKAQPRNR